MHLSNITLLFTPSIPLYHQCLSSTLQQSTHIHPYYKLISDGARRISNLSTSFTSIPHQALLDHHCAHISLGNLECYWKLFNRQLTRTQQFLRSLDQHPSAPTQLLTTLQLELSNIQDIYKSSETTMTSAINLLNSNQLQTNTLHKRNLLPFLGTALSWLT